MNETANKRRPDSWRTGLVAPLAWAASLALAVSGLSLAGLLTWPQSAVIAAAGVAPAIISVLALAAPRREWAQLLTVFSWTILAMSAVFVTGVVSGAAAWFVAPAVAAMAFPRRALISEASALSLIGLAVMSAMQAFGVTLSPVAGVGGLVVSAAAAAVAVVFASAGILTAWTRNVTQADVAYRAETLESLLNAAQVGIIKTDLEGRIQFASPEAINLFGAQHFEGAPPALRDLPDHLDDRSALTAAMDYALGSGAAETVEIGARRNRRAEVRLSPADGGLNVSVIDVTQRSAREQQAFSDRDAAKASNDAKSRYLAGMSHEIRTPLNAVIGFSDVMKQRMFGPMPARYAEYADLIHESGRHLLDLVGDVLDMSKIEAERYDLRREEFDARDVTASAVKLVKLRAEDTGIDLNVETALSPLTVNADRKALRQIMLNLLSNALKFTPKGGRVTVTTGSKAGDLVITVQDTGAGMTKEELERIGRPYQQAESAAGSEERGSGLGLSLVASLVALHDGDFELESEPGEGTTAYVRLPVLVAATAGEPERMDARARLQKAQEAGERIQRAAAEG